MLGAESGDERAWSIESDDLAAIDDGHAITQQLGFVHVVRRQQDGAALGSVPRQQVPQLAARLRVEPGRRLVEKQQVGLSHQRAGQREPLLLSAGELADPAGALRVEFDQRQHLVDRAAALRKRSEQADRLLDRELVVELCFLELNAEPPAQRAIASLAPALAEHFHLTGIGRREAFEDLYGGRLAGTVGAEQAEALAAPHLEIETRHGHDVGKALDQIVASDC